MDKSNKQTIYLLNTFALKFIAVIAMTIDHTAAVFNNYHSGTSFFSEETYYILRAVGRIAFPIFCFIIVEGFYHTHNIIKYIIRLAIFSIISQIPYTLALYNTVKPRSFNIFIQLTLGLIVITVIDRCIKSIKEKANSSQRDLVLAIIIFAVAYFIDEHYAIDYGIYGLYLILIFYFLRVENKEYENDNYVLKLRLYQALSTFIITYLFSGDIQFYCLISFIFILMYNQKRGPSMKYFFYAYYPIHLLALYGISQLL